jgi:hypothetical protein
MAQGPRILTLFQETLRPELVRLWEVGFVEVDWR